MSVKQGVFTNQLPPLLQLVELDVVRGIYCSQGMVNNISRHLWTVKPELIRELTEFETIQDVILSHTGNHTKVCEWILVHLMEEADEDVSIPETRLGRLDLLYEISRRIRKALNVSQIEAIGHSLAETREGSFPVMIALPVAQGSIESERVSQELTDKIILEAYTAHPELFYDYAEQKRLLVFSYEIKQSLETVIWSMRPEEEKENGAFMGTIMQEINARLNKICGFSEDLKFKV